MKYVIIGNSTAAIGAVEGIRSRDAVSEITVISSEPYHTYSRPLISYLLEGKTDIQRMKYRPDSFYEDNRCKAELGKTVTEIDAQKKSVRLDSGESVKYDKLLIATGSSPFVPPMQGLEKVENKFSFMTLDDAEALSRQLGSEKSVLIIGGGLIGLKCAEGIADRVKKVTVVDLSERILSSILDSEGSETVKRHLQNKGIDFHLGVSAEHFTENTALLTNGETLEFDLLVLAVGVRPNTALALEAGAQVNRGIVTAPGGETSLKDIYAAGDCCETHDISSGSDKVIAILPNAYHGGFTAGVNMAGGSEKNDNAFPMNAIGFFGLHIITAGSYEGSCYEETGDGYSKKLFYSDNRLRGFILIGRVEKAGIYTALLREETPLDSVDFDLLCKEPNLAAFSREYRKKALGGITQ